MGIAAFMPTLLPHCVDIATEPIGCYTQFITVESLILSTPMYNVKVEILLVWLHKPMIH